MKRFCKINVILTGLLIAVGICFGTSITARADDLSGGGTGQGGSGGNNTYTFYYNYDPGQDAIVLTVKTSKKTNTFGGTKEHTFTKGDGTVLNTSSPQLGSPLDGALQSLISTKGLNMSVATAKAMLNNLGYWDKGNGVWVCNGGYLTYVEGSKVKVLEHTVSYDLAGGSGDFQNQTKKEGEQMYLNAKTPTRLGYKFSHWSSSLGNFHPGDNYTHDQDGGTVTLTAQWIDVTPPMVNPATGGRETAITATPNYWSSGNGTVSIRAYDGQTGIYSVALYRISSVDANLTCVSYWAEPEGVFDKQYSYTETNEGAYAYWVLITDRAGNQHAEYSNWIYIDKTKPSLSGSSFRGCGELDAPVAKLRNADGSINSEAYGLYTTVQVSDAVTNRSVSNIKYIYIKVYDANNPSNVKYYDAGKGSTKKIQCSFNGKETEVLQPCNSFVELNKETFASKGYIIDVTKDFKNILNLKYELHTVDYAGNENVLYGAHNREARLYGTIQRLTPDESFTSSSAFKGGYKGVLTITTTGWVDQVNIKWPEEIYIGRTEDESLGQPIMNYDALVYKTPGREIEKSSIKDEQYQKEIEELKYKSTHDSLTNVKNRVGFDEDLQASSQFLIIAFDVNDLKFANDTYGHEKGDLLLTTISTELCNIFGTDNVYRMGGDEFNVLIHENILQENEVNTRLKKLDKILEKKTKSSKDIIYQVAYGYAYSSDGDFIQLQDGTNTITYNAESGINYLSVSVYYRISYLGV